ncbi:kelch repeat-containing protein [Leptolyngbya sp. 7M]|uniref:kelch repeat-containing protein n=1 Tax=Leptolyngbya sp. 7M TaxID=2812896 RepID=UPI001B8CCC56|nr:kelch repeat-containing protein [Leptolyngbya sp. 7M]QYO66746.1 hypothetical protein JVX88_08055 [Leptolyngbya sp. 7M]
MTIKRHKHDAVLIKDGRVLIIGGSNERDSAGKYRSVEAFDPAKNKFSGVGEMKMERFKHIGTSILLPNGKILIAGGADRAELFDPETGRSELAEGKLSGYSSFSTATLMKEGGVLITGGYNDQIAVGATAYVFVP